MANLESFPSALFPLRGDVSAEAGNVTVEVTGLQTVNIAPNPLDDQAVPTYVAANMDIEWQVPVFNELNTEFISLIPGDVLVWDGEFWINAPIPGGGGGGGLVDSVFGRIGNVFAESHDFASVPGLTLGDGSGDSLVFSSGVNLQDSVGDQVNLASGAVYITDSAGDAINMATGTIEITDADGDGLVLESGTISLNATGLTFFEAQGGGGAYFTFNDGTNSITSDSTDELMTIQTPILHVTGTSTGGQLQLGGHLVAGSNGTATTDIAGTVTISNPATTATISFTEPFTDANAPVIVVTFVGANPTALGAAWVTNIGGAGNWTGFTINVVTAPVTSASINYHVIGSAS